MRLHAIIKYLTVKKETEIKGTGKHSRQIRNKCACKLSCDPQALLETTGEQRDRSEVMKQEGNVGVSIIL
jgi:hypothetical protein